MADKKSNKHYHPITFPFGVARFPYLSKPDTEQRGNFKPDGKFKTEIVLSPADTKAVKEQLQKLAAEWFPGIKHVKLPIKKGKKDDVVSFIAKKQKRPVVVDAKRKPIPASVEVGGGSIIRINVTATNYEQTEKVRDKETGETVNETSYGINLYLEAVQVKELKQYGDPLAGFGDEDGFDGADAGADAHGFSDESGEQPQSDDAYKL